MAQTTVPPTTTVNNASVTKWLFSSTRQHPIQNSWRGQLHNSSIWQSLLRATFFWLMFVIFFPNKMLQESFDNINKRDFFCPCTIKFLIGRLTVCSLGQLLNLFEFGLHLIRCASFNFRMTSHLHAVIKVVRSNETSLIADFSIVWICSKFSFLTPKQFHIQKARSSCHSLDWLFCFQANQLCRHCGIGIVTVCSLPATAVRKVPAALKNVSFNIGQVCDV